MLVCLHLPVENTSITIDSSGAFVFGCRLHPQRTLRQLCFLGGVHSFHTFTARNSNVLLLTYKHTFYSFNAILTSVCGLALTPTSHFPRRFDLTDIHQRDQKRTDQVTIQSSSQQFIHPDVRVTIPSHDHRTSLQPFAIRIKSEYRA